MTTQVPHHNPYQGIYTAFLIEIFNEKYHLINWMFY